jgi:hypothetical protein
MSVLPPKADIGGHEGHVRYGPEADNRGYDDFSVQSQRASIAATLEPIKLRDNKCQYPSWSNARKRV